ncbi:HNH endonuclease [Priestia aryabhattai]|uniref:HNH endonuclease n=1 Tax=Priestia aryabhattai TaxID=412384 RepID=UPI001C8D1141|nr:HNH endonuclease [Priestia aryabhattai]MBY0001437.1 HNH endonuclease [Priestia aryabhattai]
MHWLEKAADAGHKIANYALGYFYYQFGTEASYRKAIKRLLWSSNSGYSPADYLLGIAYYYGHGCNRDTAKAKHLLEKVLESNLLDQNQIIVSALIVQEIMKKLTEPQYENIALISINTTGKNVMPLRQKQLVSTIQRSNQLVSELKVLYNNCCQACRRQLDLGREHSYSEVHHICPLGSPHNGPDVVENMIVLCSDHHAMFGRGAITLDLDRNVVLHTNNFNSIHGQNILLLHRIGQNYIKYHNDFIFLNFS